MHFGPTRAADGPHKLDFIGDHLAIDFINTLRAVEPFEIFQTDEDVTSWLLSANVPPPRETANWPKGELLKKARQLREIASKAVQARKAGRRSSLVALNSFLEHAASHPQLMYGRGSKIAARKVYSRRTAEELLAPI